MEQVSSAYYLQKYCPNKTYTIIEAREAIGGTWDLFRYPGIRCDSDMFTYSFKFKPWVSSKAIVPGKDLHRYINEAATENGINQHIKFGHKAIAANWNSSIAKWTMKIKNVTTEKISTISSKFLFSCAGYYNYEQAYTPKFKDANSFSGEIIQPQFWPSNLDYADKNIIVIGSGATAISLAPELAKTAGKVIMLQRSPSYVLSISKKDKLANILRHCLPIKMIYSIIRWKNIISIIYLYRLCKRQPNRTKQLIIKAIKKALGNQYDIEKHFVPNYKPWDQRLGVTTDNLLFQSIKEGKIALITDHIESFTPEGIKLQSGKSLSADIIVTATGLKAEIFSGLQLSVDNQIINPANTVAYKGMLLSSLPNFAFYIGFVNAAWTLKCDLVSKYLCRLLNYMDNKSHDYFMPMAPEGLELKPILDFSSSYILRAMDQFPKEATTRPWKLYQNYILDSLSLNFRSVVDKYMFFGKAN